jgi:preprotein translocase subunit SecG
MGFLIGLMTAIHVIVALFLIGLVLMQKSPDQGVGAAFGGGVTEQVFGGGTTTALVRMTIWCASILLGTTLVLAVLHAKRGTAPGLMRRAVETATALPLNPASPAPSLPLTEQPAQTPAASATPATPAAPSATAPAGPATPPAATPTAPSEQQPEKSP